MQLDGYLNPDAEQLLVARTQRLVRELRERRELVTNCVGAAAFLLSATALAVLAP